MEELLAKLEAQQQKIDAIYASVEKLKNYFRWTLIITVVTIVLPILGALIMVPMLLNSLSGMYQGIL